MTSSDNNMPGEVERQCVDLVRRMAANSSMGRPFSEGQIIRYSSAHYEEARAIAAALKPGWDVDGICNDHGKWLCQRCALPAALTQQEKTDAE